MELQLLPLDSSRWQKLKTPGGRGRASEMTRLVGRILERREFGEEWKLLYDDIIHQGGVYESTYAVLPHVVAIAAELEPAALVDFWIDIGFVIGGFLGVGRPDPIPEDLYPCFQDALSIAEPLALSCFCSATCDETQTSYLALSCIALSRHPVGQTIWENFSPPQPNREFIKQQFFTAECPECQFEPEWMHVGDGILDYELGKADPSQPDRKQPAVEALDVPDLSSCKRSIHPWTPIAHALAKPFHEIQSLPCGEVFPDGFTRHFGMHIPVAHVVAAAGVPTAASNRTVLTLIGIMVALKGSFDWGGRLLRLAGVMHCPGCGKSFPFANCLQSLFQR